MSIAPLSLDLLPARATATRVRPASGATARGLLAAGDVVTVVGFAALVGTPSAALVGAAVVALLAIRGAYRPRFTAQVGALLSRLVTSVAVATVGAAAMLPAAEGMRLVRAAPALALALVATRIVTGALVRRVRATAPGEPTIIVGAGAVGNRIAAALLEHPEFGLFPIGIVDDVDDTDLAVPMLGASGDLAAIAGRFGVANVIVAFGKADEARMVDVLRTCHEMDADVWVVPRLFELGGAGCDVDELWGVPITPLHRRALRTGQWRMKRAFDVVCSVALLLASLPLLAAIAVAVKLSSPGPVFHRQLRVGQRGRIVEVLKFRSMRVNDDGDRTWNVCDDPRVTWIGRILRPSSLDELPQLLNVLRGDMSLVGPRPERPHFVDLFNDSVPGYEHRHRVPVGLTGLAQVNGLRGDTSIEDRARFDNRYIEQWSLWGDLVILARTVWAVVRPPASVKVTAAPVEPAIDLTGSAAGHADHDAAGYARG